nr:tetratricopeptide repeat protein [uncultured Cohaesibacter sp.]
MANLSPQTLLSRAQKHIKKNELEDAIGLYQAIIDKYPGNVRARKGLEKVEAMKFCSEAGAQSALEQINTLLEIYNQGMFNQAVDFAEKLLKIHPSNSDIWNIYGGANRALKNKDKAIRGFHKACQLDPNNSSKHNNLGAALEETGRTGEAIASYKRSLNINPNNALVHYNLGNILSGQKKYKDAVTSYLRAVELKPDYEWAYRALSGVYESLGTFDKAIEAHLKVINLASGDTAAHEAALLKLNRIICDWNEASKYQNALFNYQNSAAAIPPSRMLSIYDDPHQQLLWSKKWAEGQYKQVPLELPSRPQKSERLRIGYFSSDFHEHATMFLMSGLLRCHDKTRIEVFAYSYGSNKNGTCRENAEKVVEHFFDVADDGDLDIVKLARSHELDIAIDLKGYTGDTRSEIFQYRLAPLQIAYLGYPGSMGAPFIDYIIADPVVVPVEHYEHYSEKIITLPHCYQPNDNMRKISSTENSRKDEGLPEDGFVFCSFNSSYKISSVEFDIWMRLLDRVKGSVLWLINSNRWVKTNLEREASKRGIDPRRLIFAKQAPQADHLARHKHADLFLDSFNCNAHTTASDALYAGLPIVTKIGEQFAARVAASLLTAVGLPELITYSIHDYEQMALELATNSQRLKEVRSKLSRNIKTEPLFDTERYTRNFESALFSSHSLFLSGHKPQDILVTEKPVTT